MEGFDLNVFRTRYELPEIFLTTLNYGFYAFHVLNSLFDPSHKIPWLDVPIAIKAELHQIAFVVFQALQRAIRLEWDVYDYAEVLEQEDLTEGEQMERFPPNIGTFDGTRKYLDVEHEPCAFIDRNGRILWLYLPAIIREDRWTEICDAVAKVSATPNPPFGRPPSLSKADYTKRFKDSPQLARGATHLFPADFEPRSRSSLPSDLPFPCLPFRVDERYHGFWLLDNIGSDTMAILGAVLALAQPALFHVSLEMFERLSNRDVSVGQPWVFDEVLRRWASPFQSFSIYNDHSQPPHRYANTHPMGFDLFLSAGDVLANRFTAPTLGREFYFDPGTICIGLGHLICHGWVTGGDGDHIVCHFSVMEELANYFDYLMAPPSDNDCTC
ncbi:hypothetical protein CC1G_09454 [Coprinopsis cinerea okayama7|uniref:Uncharacterized protein n=1 Tax=Coprinopsis cinerea (strain Okayama-7 / 130 / ATCC MYA-4618 / FGSC 9003) TaxID=240176 RepID=A8PDB9_COPC7|nr:hypothetical protein CC1G_09454 [Coprinopsis cinerea okayama7\|eukprot:XP_001840570.2 hypothetical protein CC1G_09454 [Coprinopsis cinerea okayama7\